MDNQHKKISGYRDLTQEEIDAINNLKEMAEDVGNLLDDVADVVEDADKRWLAIARTDLQKGFMSAVRAVARPETF